MPTESDAIERSQGVYTADVSNEDNKSDITERSVCITYRDPDYVDLAALKHTNGNVLHGSPALSTITVDKWSSYWSKRERCCCFLNFLLTVTVIVLVTFVVLATKENSSKQTDGNRSRSSSGKFSSGDIVIPMNLPDKAGTAVTKTCTDSSCMKSAVEILSKMNTSADPCEDFYSFACGGFTEKTRLSWNSARKRTNPDIIMDNHYQFLLDELSEDISKTDSKEKRIIKKIFRSCVNRRDTPLTQVKELIDSLGGFEFGPSPKTRTLELTELITEVAMKYGVWPLFQIHAHKDGYLTINNQFSDEMVRDWWSSGHMISTYKFLKPSDFIYRNEESDSIMQAYRTHIGDCIAYLIGINESVRGDQQFVSIVDDMFHLNVYLNRVFYKEDSTNEPASRTDCMEISLSDIEYHYNYNISWRKMLSTMFEHTPFSHNYTVCSVTLTNALADVLSAFNFTTLKRYIIFQVLTQSDMSIVLPRMTPKFDKIQWEHGALYGETSSIVFSDYTCMRQNSKLIPMYFVILNQISDQFNDSLRRLYTDLITSIDEIIKDLYWMPVKQKRHLFRELQGLSLELEWKHDADDSFMFHMQNVSDDYFHNLRLMVGYSMKKYISGTPIQIITHKASSIFSLEDKILEVPISALEVPFLYATQVPSLWLGSLGTYISQAISQLFDIEALLRFLTQEKIDHKVALTIAFRLQCLLDEYKKYPLVTRNGQTEYIRGDLTKNANFRDSLALRVVYNTYGKRKDGSILNIPGVDMTQDQLFFLSYAQSMCEKRNDRGTYHYYADTSTTSHSPGKYRVIGTLSHFKKFTEAFECATHSAMNPENKCTLF